MKRLKDFNSPATKACVTKPLIGFYRKEKLPEVVHATTERDKRNHPSLREHLGDTEMSLVRGTPCGKDR